jgi:hypothetical protein
MARTGIGGRARRRCGFAGAVIVGGLLPASQPRTWEDLQPGLTMCDEVTPTFAEPLDLTERAERPS